MFDRILLTVLEGATALGAVIAGYLLITGLSGNAMQTAANAACAVAFIGIPYCLAATMHRSLARDRWKRD